MTITVTETYERCPICRGAGSVSAHDWVFYANGSACAHCGAGIGTGAQCSRMVRCGACQGTGRHLIGRTTKED